MLSVANTFWHLGKLLGKFGYMINFRPWRAFSWWYSAPPPRESPVGKGKSMQVVISDSFKVLLLCILHILSNIGTERSSYVCTGMSLTMSSKPFWEWGVCDVVLGHYRWSIWLKCGGICIFKLFNTYRWIIRSRVNSWVGFFLKKLNGCILIRIVLKPFSHSCGPLLHADMHGI